MKRGRFIGIVFSKEENGLKLIEIGYKLVVRYWFLGFYVNFWDGRGVVGGFFIIERKIGYFRDYRDGLFYFRWIVNSMLYLWE